MTDAGKTLEERLEAEAHNIGDQNGPLDFVVPLDTALEFLALARAEGAAEERAAASAKLDRDVDELVKEVVSSKFTEEDMPGYRNGFEAGIAHERAAVLRYLERLIPILEDRRSTLGFDAKRKELTP